MALGIINLQWLNHNQSRAYPITDWATKQDISQTIRVPDDFLVSLCFPVHAGLDVEPEKFFLRDLGIYPTGFNIGIGYDDGSDDGILVAVVNVAISMHTENLSYAVTGVGDYDDCVGTLAIGQLDSINQLPPGQYRFAYADGAIEVDCIRPMIRGISSIICVNGADSSERLYGDIVLVAGNNMRITATAGASPSIRFDAIQGEGLTETCVCDADSVGNQGPPIRFINGIPPLPDGNFRLIGDSCLDLAAVTNGIKMSDTCSKPCCGCDELNALITQIDQFASGVATLQNFVRDLSAAVTNMNQTVLGSKLNDQCCVES